jgi:hypothetical protein
MLGANGLCGRITPRKESLPAFFEAYGERPSWEGRQLAMIDRCHWLETSRTVGILTVPECASGSSPPAKQQRTSETAAWTE